MENKPHKLFISHSSKDAEYMKAFVDLLVAIGVHIIKCFPLKIQAFQPLLSQ